MNARPIILCFLKTYLPGYKGGGPVRSIANLVAQLSDEFDFRIVTTDRDINDEMPYTDIVTEQWNTIKGAQVYYCSPRRRSIVALVRLIAVTPHDAIYINSFFDPIFSIRVVVARMLRLLPRRPLILASRGEFSIGAVTLKRWKKWPYMLLARALNMYDDLTWQASTVFEAEDILHRMKPKLATNVRTASDLVIAANLLDPYPHTLTNMSVQHRKERLAVVFLSRISRMKNLDFALRVLQRILVPVTFRIYGPIEDSKYWDECLALIATLPSHIDVEISGPIPPERVSTVLSEHDLFFLPTRGENFGHVIAEALAVGTPVLVSDRTPWRGLEHHDAGWDLPLSDSQSFANAIELAAARDGSYYAGWRMRVREYYLGRSQNSVAVEENRRLFRSALGI